MNSQFIQINSSETADLFFAGWERKRSKCNYISKEAVKPFSLSPLDFKKEIHVFSNNIWLLVLQIVGPSNIQNGEIHEQSKEFGGGNYTVYVCVVLKVCSINLLIF